jgi:hypothetical protein
VSMETVALSRRAIREKLMNPPNGRDSSELEVTSEASLRRIEREASLLQKEEDERKAHKARVALLVEQIKQRKEEWRQAEVAWLQLLANRGLTATRIADICCKHFKVNPLEVIGLRRRAYICYARHIIAYLCCTETKKACLRSAGFSTGTTPRFFIAAT